jgi:ribokinase
MPSRPKIVVVGSANTDWVLRVAHLPKPGETVTSSRSFQVLGGKGANQAVAAARLGAEVTFVCKLGRDEYGQGCYNAYQAEGMNLDYLGWDAEAQSGVALIFVSDAGENMIGLAPGANMGLTEEDVARAAEAIAGADCLLLQFEVPQAADLKAIQIARRHGVKVILNPAPPIPFPVEFLEQINVLTPNETELDFILKHFDPGAGQDPLAWLTARVPNLIVTLGAQGCRWVTAERDESYPPFAVQAIDTTAAGDAFNGGLAVALARGLEMPAAIRFASAVGALSVTRLGAMSSLPSAAEVEKFLVT